MNKKNLRILLKLILFLVLLGLTIIGLGIVSLLTIGPTFTGLAGILVPTFITLPLAIVLYLIFAIKNVRWPLRFGLPLLILPVLFGLVCAYTLGYERSPQNMFQVFVHDPIPDGVSHIQAQDVSAGIDMDIILAFEATPNACQDIILKNHLSSNGVKSELKDDLLKTYYPDLMGGSDWVEYSYSNPDEFIFMWFNYHNNSVLIHYGTF
jgi:hypothetical protein